MLTFIKLSTGGDNQEHVSRPISANDQQLKANGSLKRLGSKKLSFADCEIPEPTQREGPSQS